MKQSYFTMFYRFIGILITSLAYNYHEYHLEFSLAKIKIMSNLKYDLY